MQSNDLDSDDPDPREFLCLSAVKCFRLQLSAFDFFQMKLRAIVSVVDHQSAENNAGCDAQ
jgi:hypothetical protein